MGTVIGLGFRVGSLKGSLKSSLKGSLKGSITVTQRLHIYYHCGIRCKETILIMVLGTEFHNGSTCGASVCLGCMGFLPGFRVWDLSSRNCWGF